jgi:hypothetical protein
LTIDVCSVNNGGCPSEAKCISTAEHRVNPSLNCYCPPGKYVKIVKPVSVCSPLKSIFIVSGLKVEQDFEQAYTNLSDPKTVAFTRLLEETTLDISRVYTESAEQIESPENFKADSVSTGLLRISLLCSKETNHLLSETSDCREV